MGGWYQWEREDMGRGVGGGIWYKYCVHIYVNEK
jgi:hypothetical protein